MCLILYRLPVSIVGSDFVGVVCLNGMISGDGGVLVVDGDDGFSMVCW